MRWVPPFWLVGEAGKGLGPSPVAAAAMGVQDATLTLRSLEAGTLTFALRDNGQRPAIPDDGQVITLLDDNGMVMFTGVAKRAFSLPGRIYRFVVSDVYAGLAETPVTGDDGRPFLLYGQRPLGQILADLMRRARAAGLAVQGPAAVPDFLTVPKMAFRAQSFAGALEGAAKWAPDLATRMDYGTAPPTLRFLTRSESEGTLIDLDADGHGVTAMDLTPAPELRALAVSFAYARRTGNDAVLYLTQRAGNDAAEARRKLSLYLSGSERTDNFVTEALLTAQKAVAMAQATADAVGAAVAAAAATAQIPLTWDGLRPLNSTLVAAQAADPTLVMYATGGGVTLFSGIGYGGGSPWTGTVSMGFVPVTLQTAAGAAATGWYPVQAGAFTSAQLATAGATKETRYLRGDLYAVRGWYDSNDGMAVLQSAGGASIAGYTQGYVAGGIENTYPLYQKYQRFPIDIAVDAINKSPAEVAAAVTAAANSAGGGLISRAEFVEAPEGLAEAYFRRQDWTPYKGTMTLAPSAEVRLPGEFISVRGGGAPADWEAMGTPVAEAETDLGTGVTRLTLGPGARQDFASLVDRLRIPAEDNYQPG